MGFAEDEFFKYLRKNRDIWEKLQVRQMLTELPEVFSVSNEEQLRVALQNNGNSYVTFDFLNDLRKRDNWVNHFLQGLWRTEQLELYNHLREVYRNLQPNRPIHSPPNKPGQPDTPPRCVSLPLPMNPNLPEQSPSEPLSLPLPNASSEHTPSTQPKHYISPANPSAGTRTPMDDVDSGALDGIIKMPTPESSSFQTPPTMENNGASTEVSDTPRQVSSPPVAQEEQTVVKPKQGNSVAGSSIKHLPMSPGNKSHNVNKALIGPYRQEVPVHQQVTESTIKHLPIYPANKVQDVSNAQPEPQQEAPGHQSVFIDTIKNPTILPENNSHEVINTEPQQQEVPAHQPVAESTIKHLPIYPANTVRHVSNAQPEPQQQEGPGHHSVVESTIKHLPILPTNKSRDVGNARTEPQQQASGHQPVVESTNKHLPLLPTNKSRDVGNARTEPQQQQVPGHQPISSQSSCRPLEDNLYINKPGVLSSNLEDAGSASRDETSEISQFSLQISDASGSPQASERVQQLASEHPQASTNNGSLPPEEKPPTNTLRKSGPPARHPEENAEPDDYSSRFPGPEENHYDTPSSTSSFRLHYREEVPTEDMEVNSAPRRRIVTTPKSKESSDSNKCSYKNNLEDPVVIVLATTVVCLVLYIVWLKRKV